MRSPQPRIGFDGLAVVGDRILESIVQLELTRYPRVCLAVARVDGLDLGKPRVGRTVREQFQGRVDGHRIQRMRVKSDGFVGLDGSRFAIVVGKGRGLPSVRALRPALDRALWLLRHDAAACPSKPSAATSASPR